MNIEQEKVGDVLVLRVREPQVTSHEAPELKTRLLGAMTGDHDRIVLHLEEVVHMDSTGLGALLFGIRQADQHDKDLRFSGVQNKVQFLIHVAHLDEVIPFHPTVDQAVASFLKDGGDGPSS
jgi:anti-sigma B factor antagonist